MKRSIAPAVAACCLALSGLQLAAPAQDDLAQMRQELAVTRESVQTLTVELGETRDLLDRTILYVDAQARAAQAMESALRSSEEAGFTAGINFQSREILLAGWRQLLSSAQKDLPGAPPADPAAH